MQYRVHLVFQGSGEKHDLKLVVEAKDAAAAQQSVYNYAVNEKAYKSFAARVVAPRLTMVLVEENV